MVPQRGRQLSYRMAGFRVANTTPRVLCVEGIKPHVVVLLYAHPAKAATGRAKKIDTYHRNKHRARRDKGLNRGRCAHRYHRNRVRGNGRIASTFDIGGEVSLHCNYAPH